MIIKFKTKKKFQRNLIKFEKFLESFESDSFLLGSSLQISRKIIFFFFFCSYLKFENAPKFSSHGKYRELKNEYSKRKQSSQLSNTNIRISI